MRANFFPLTYGAKNEWSQTIGHLVQRGTCQLDRSNERTHFARLRAAMSLGVEKHARMTHEEANWRLSLTLPSGYSNSFSSGNEGKATRDNLHRKDWHGSSRECNRSESLESESPFVFRVYPERDRPRNKDTAAPMRCACGCGASFREWGLAVTPVESNHL